MTAEIAILNKECVALAADSMVTISTPDGNKTYSNNNKLFTLSKIHPVGALTWGGTDIQTVPTELLIKEFRKSIKDSSRNALKTYFDELIDFVRKKTVWNKDEDNANFRYLCYAHLEDILWRFRRRCRESDILVHRRPFNLDGGTHYDEAVTELREQANTAGLNKYLASVSVADLHARYPDIIEKITKEELEDYSPTSAQVDATVDAIATAILSNLPSDASCGLAVAGYGDEEYYPSLSRCEVEGFICGILKLTKEKETQIGSKRNASIIPLAQRAAADAFITGVDPRYQRFINDTIAELLPGIADESAKHFGISDAAQIAALRSILQRKGTVFNRALAQRRRDRFVNPLTQTVALLDKLEMAALAENLVAVTALRQKVTLETETVGGAIDVAVISKHDGFIWMKRKHYFAADRNPFFFRNYLRDIGSP